MENVWKYNVVFHPPSTDLRIQYQDMGLPWHGAAPFDSVWNICTCPNAARTHNTKNIHEVWCVHMCFIIVHPWNWAIIQIWQWWSLLDSMSMRWVIIKIWLLRGKSDPALWIPTSAAGNVILYTSGQCSRYGRGLTYNQCELAATTAALRNRFYFLKSLLYWINHRPLCKVKNA